MKKKNKIKSIVLTSSFIGATVIIGVSTALPTYFSLQNNNIGNKLFSFDGKTYNNFNDLFNELSSQYFVASKSFNHRYKWSIDDGNGNNTLFFNDPLLLRKKVMDYIKTYNGFSSLNIENNPNFLGANNELSTEALLKIYFDNYNNLQQTVYRGRNNSIHLSEEDAKKSYLSIHDAYYFNNLYFSNKEQLELYLNNVYFVEGNNNTLQKMLSVINNSNDLQSSAISQDDLFKDLNNVDESKRKDVIETKKSFANFIGLGANKYIQFENNNSRTLPIYSYYKKDDIYSSAQLVNEFDNPDYTKLYENDGKSTYIVDLDKEDEANLFGPYFLSSLKSIEMMKNKDQWYERKTENKIITKQKDVYLLSSLFETILLADNSTINLPINIRFLNKSILIPYFSFLKNQYSGIYFQFIDFLDNIQKGKNFNKFYELIISYIWLINNLISINASETMIKETKKTFDAIAQFADQVIYLIFPQNLLRGNNGTLISFKKIFEFKDNNKNLNTDINYYVDTISKNYPQFIVALAIMSLGIINSSFNGSAIDFKYDKFSKLVEKSCSYEDQRMKFQYRDDYEFIYNIFSVSEMDSFYNFLKNTTQYLNSNFKNKEAIIKEISLFNFSKLEFSMNAAKIDYFSKNNLSDSNFVFVTTKDKNSVFYNLPLNIAIQIISINNKALNNEKKLSFENFLLIKMILKMNIFSYDKIFSLLLKFAENQISQQNLHDELNNILDSFSIEQFSQNFQIIENSIDIMFNVYKTKRDEYNQSINKSLEMASNIFNGSYEFISKTFKNTIDIIQSTMDIAKSSSEIIKIASLSANVVSGILGWAGIVMQAVSLILDAFIPKTEFISYVFETENGQEYIWDGGRRTTMFWGLWEISSVGIEKMKLIGPEKILDANNKEQYYFDGKKYDTLDVLKKEQLRQIINGSYSAESIKNVYSWENLKGETSFKPDGVFDEEHLGDWNSIINIDFNDAISSSFIPQDVVQYVYQKIALDINNKKENSKYFKSSFKFAGGFGNNSSVGDIKEIIVDILDNIKTVKIVQLPNINDDKKPLSINGSGDDGSISEFVLPDKSWSFMAITYNETNNKYIIYDPNVENKNNENINDSLEVEKWIEKQFFAQFDVDSKKAIKYEIQTTNLYSDLSQNINAYQVYAATLPNGETKTFLGLDKAFDWLLAKMNFTMYQYQIIESTYDYKGIVFNSKQEFRNYVLNNMEVKDA